MKKSGCANGGCSSSCAEVGGCPSDYVALSISIISLILLLARAASPFLIHKVRRPKGSSFWLPAIQVLASFDLLLSLVMSLRIFKYTGGPWWRSCYIWAVWFEGPLGFGLLLSSRITQAFQLYHIFLKRRLPPIRSYIFLPLILLPWVALSAFLHFKRPLNGRCHMGIHYIIPNMSLHGLYIVALVAFTGAIHHIEFRFHELKDLWRGILVSTTSVAIWIVSYVLNEIHEETEWLQVTSRFMLLLAGGVLVLAFFSVSSSQPLVSVMSLKNKENQDFSTMGWALGIPDSGQLLHRETAKNLDPNEPLEKLLLDKRFLQSFMAFADSCLAGESVHFYDEVQQHDKIPVSDTVRRIYMARHIIQKYITAGAPMEVNISHRSRQDILTTADLAHPDLFRNALNEIIQLMRMNLARDYWSSMFFMKFKEEANMKTVDHESEQLHGWNFSPRLSSVHCTDDPFHQDHNSSDSIQHSGNIELH